MWQSDITKWVTAHTLCHSFATHLIEADYDTRTMPEPFNHGDVRTAMTYADVLHRDSPNVTEMVRTSPVRWTLAFPTLANWGGMRLSSGTEQDHARFGGKHESP